MQHESERIINKSEVKLAGSKGILKHYINGS
jgi:hypothetical protein